MKYELTIHGEPDELANILIMAASGTAAEAPTTEVMEDAVCAIPEVAPEPVKAEPAPEPEAEPEPVKAEPIEHAPSMKDVRAVMKAAIDDGKRDALEALLAKRGAKRVTDLAESDIPAFYAEVKVL